MTNIMNGDGVISRDGKPDVALMASVGGKLHCEEDEHLATCYLSWTWIHQRQHVKQSRLDGYLCHSREYSLMMVSIQGRCQLRYWIDICSCMLHMVGEHKHDNQKYIAKIDQVFSLNILYRVKHHENNAE